MRAQLVTRFQQTYGVAPTVVARAPGRVEFIGNHTDYNGGPVLGAAIDRHVWVALAPRPDGRRRFRSDQHEGEVTLASSAMGKNSGPASWVNYPLGVLAVLPEFGLPAPPGFDFLAMSDLPAGAGLSSSAAIELASALVFLAAAGEPSVPPMTLAQIGRRAENQFVGVPCGLLDQGVSAFGQPDRLVLIDCATPSFRTVPLPADARFWLFNTPTGHALADGLYAARHRECMAAAQLLGVDRLADLTPAEFELKQSVLTGAPARRARHVIGEIARVGAAVEALRTGNLAAVGALLTASHRSSQRWFENSTAGLDFLVDALTASPHVHGARLTGGGFGGAVLALTSGDFSAADAGRVAEDYAEKFGSPPDILPVRTGAGAGLVGPD